MPDTRMPHCLYAWQHREQMFAVGHFPILTNSLTVQIFCNIDLYTHINISSMNASSFVYIDVVIICTMMSFYQQILHSFSCYNVLCIGNLTYAGHFAVCPSTLWSWPWFNVIWKSHRIRPLTLTRNWIYMNVYICQKQWTNSWRYMQNHNHRCADYHERLVMLNKKAQYVYSLHNPSSITYNCVFCQKLVLEIPYKCCYMVYVNEWY